MQASTARACTRARACLCAKMEDKVAKVVRIGFTLRDELFAIERPFDNVVYSDHDLKFLDWQYFVLHVELIYCAPKRASY